MRWQLAITQRPQHAVILLVVVVVVVVVAVALSTAALSDVAR